MKKLSGLLTGIMIAGVVSAQQTDTMPSNSNAQPNMPTDTVPSKNWNNTDSTNKNWNNNMDSSKSNATQWADSTQHNNSNNNTVTDSLNAQKKTWESGDSTANNNNNSSTATDSTATATTSSLSDRVMMRDGSMYLIKNGVESKMTEDVTLPTGGKVAADGTVTMASGKTVKLKDGQYIEMKTDDSSNATDDGSTKKETSKKTGKKKSTGKKKKTTDQ